MSDNNDCEELELIFRANITAKLLQEHKVTKAEVEQCFVYAVGKLLIDNRENNKTNPPTLWFISETSSGRVLKICYIRIGNEAVIKTAYEPNKEEIRIYDKYGY